MTEGQLALEALQKIIAHPPFSTADSLRNLLTYLVNQTVERPGEPIREAQIAAAVFNKTESFDPRQDSTVRVQTSRLRTKLSEYYLAAGRTDTWILDVPKGSYAVTIRERELPPEPPACEAPVASVAPSQPSPWWFALAGFATGVGVTLLAVRWIG